MKTRKDPIVALSPGAPAAADAADGDAPQQPSRSGPDRADDAAPKIDRPGFDLGGSTGETHAGTGLGLGDDASDTPGDRRLSGRRPDGELTIPRWSGTDRQESAAPVKTVERSATRSSPALKGTAD